MSNTSSTVRIMLVAGAMALLAACSILPKNEVVQIWQPPEDNNAITASNARFSLRVDTPNASGLIGNDGIIVMPQPGQVSTYKGARWSEAPPTLVRQRLVDAFMAAKLPAVTTDDDHFYADYTLSGDLRAFQSEYRGGSPVVVVRYDAQLRRGGSRDLIATHSFVVTQKPGGVGVPQIVDAFGAADDELARQIVAWTLQVAGSDAVAHPSDAGPASRH